MGTKAENKKVSVKITAAAGKQLPLPLPVEPAFGQDDYIVSPANKNAFDWITKHRHSSLFLHGPKGSGKTHLAFIWCNLNQAPLISAVSLKADFIRIAASLEKNNQLAIEDIDADGVDQHSMFALLNISRTRDSNLLLTARNSINNLPFTVPDLISRLKVFTHQSIKPPDDELLRKVMIKLFADRQLFVSAKTINYITLRIERSLESVKNVVEEIDQASLSLKKPVTTAFAARIINKMANFS